MPKHSSKVASVDNYVAPLLLNFSKCRICSKYNLPYTSINLHYCSLELKSKCFTFINGCMFLHLGRYIVRRRILSPINSKHGISVVGQKTRFKYENLNVCMPQVLQRHYGMSDKVNDYQSIKNTYGYNLTRKTVLSDPSRIFTKPFCTSMATMANMFHKVLCSNKDELRST